MNPPPLHHKFFESFLLYIIPTILLYKIIHLLIPKKFRTIVTIGIFILSFLPSEVSFIIILSLLTCAILAGFLPFCSFANEIINFDQDLDDYRLIPIIKITPPPEDTPMITITPPTDAHRTNLPPRYYQQDPVFLMVIRRSIPKKRKTKARARSPNGRPELK